MKRIVSVSLGSSRRNNKAYFSLMGEDCEIERIGTDGNMKEMIKLIKELDGKVDAFGLGGMDIYIFSGKRRYILRDAQKVAASARITPIVDGSGLKNTLERRVIHYLNSETELFKGEKNVLLVSAMDRFGMAQCFEELGCRVVYGDLPFTLGIPIPLYSLRSLSILARILVPVIRFLPFKYLYPTGKKQDVINARYPSFYHKADIIAGDFHFIRRYMPDRLDGKVIITNTVTPDDVELLRERGVRELITTTPEINGRSFGTNVMEAMLVAISGSRQELTPEEYDQLLKKIDLKPRIASLI